MKYKLVCLACASSIWVRGSFDPSVNATELDFNDDAWEDCCEHMKAGGDYKIGEAESIEDDGIDYRSEEPIDDSI